MLMTIHGSFQIPAHLHAIAPAEFRGLRRDQVRMMVLDRITGQFEHASFKEIGRYLASGDLLVFNNSRTIPAKLKGTQQQGTEFEIRLSRQISDTAWEGLIVGDYDRNRPIKLSEELFAEVIGNGGAEPLVRLSFSKKGLALLNDFYRIGEPIRYEYIHEPWALDVYQTVYAAVPGSVEMPSAGRAFTWQLLQALKASGIRVAFLQLHAGLSYYGNDKWPDPNQHPEVFHIPSSTAKLVTETKESGGRVIAVGTTVVRALETAAVEGKVTGTKGVTKLYVDRGYLLKVVDGLLTGFHEPEASHLDMLTAFIDEEQLKAAYQAAIEEGYLWHEFGDVNLILSKEASL
ncbi:S-adenosylmethionine:tRNA ribosyltransferase-isomerase [Bacillus oleivorans]|uniref:S-adenosylmethionine:tRNA ribosyltransferase-isomerase n=1 Tax=Bacillus oleivorans TaxID=1448271 RepID=A0A285CIM7_9BACI|nr:S-adenosylmethionine:tRNA ribosyltransferase-isomerase [Bacillus oleivorans]SNX66856.1 S-adenosylmethionine:tRNA ribosyltransferase-isomerase [Bacillus oleivorans]